MTLRWSPSNLMQGSLTAPVLRYLINMSFFITTEKSFMFNTHEGNTVFMREHHSKTRNQSCVNCKFHPWLIEVFFFFLIPFCSLAGDGRCKGIHWEVFTQNLTFFHLHCDLPPLICHSPSGNSHEYHLPTFHTYETTDRSWVRKNWPLNSTFMPLHC